MSAAHDVALTRGPSAVEVTASFPAPPVNPTGTSQLAWKPVARSPQQLRLHPALVGTDWINMMSEFNVAARLKNLTVPEPILITTCGTILAGFGRWQMTILDGEHEIDCLEHPLSKDQALQFILSYHRPRQGWNDFVRIRLALNLVPYFQQRALDNMRAGGKYKGSTNLPKAEHIDVRQEIAKAAGTGTGNVDKVKTIRLRAHPSIIAALQNDWLKIDRAWRWCKLSKSQQKTEFARYEEERTQRKILREFSPRHAKVSLDPCQVIEALGRTEARQPGSIAIRTSRSKRTVVILGQDLLEAPDAQKELNDLA